MNEPDGLTWAIEPGHPGEEQLRVRCNLDVGEGEPVVCAWGVLLAPMPDGHGPWDFNSAHAAPLLQAHQARLADEMRTWAADQFGPGRLVMASPGVSRWEPEGVQP